MDCFPTSSKKESTGNFRALSYWNAPVILRKLNKEERSANLTDISKPYWDSRLMNFQVEEMYCDRKVQPGRYPKTMVATGEFVDWGTKCYQLQLELSYKNNEIEIIKKKLKKVSQELYPGGDKSKKSAVEVLRSKHVASEKQLAKAKQQIKREKQRCDELSSELANTKKQYAKLKRQKLSIDKSVQTIPDNSKGTQATDQTPPKYRTVTTQFSSQSLNLTESKDFSPKKQKDNYRSRALSTSENTNLQFASAITIQDNFDESHETKPLKMCLVQEFNKGEVKTKVQANKSFRITEQPMIIGSESYEKLKLGKFGIDSQIPAMGGDEDVELSNLQSDSGFSSERLSSESPQPMLPHPPSRHKPAYSQDHRSMQVIKQGAQLTDETARTYERNLPYYMGSEGLSQFSTRNGSPKETTSYLTQSGKESACKNSNSFFREVEKMRNVAISPSNNIIPYHLFRREQSGYKHSTNGDNLIFVHTSEIKFPGY